MYVNDNDKYDIYILPVVNQYEVYGKHKHILDYLLLKKKNVEFTVIAAGEMLINKENKRIIFNLFSGTFMLNGVRAGRNKTFDKEIYRQKEMKKLLPRIFKGFEIKFIRKSLIPTIMLNAETAKTYLKKQNMIYNVQCNS